MVGKVIYRPQLKEYLNSLVYILYQKGYFGFIESSFEYIENLVYYINNNILSLTHYQVPKQLSKLGSYYIRYKYNSNTTWYILFDKTDEDIYVTFIFNNHVKYASYLEL